MRHSRVSLHHNKDSTYKSPIRGEQKTLDNSLSRARLSDAAQNDSSEFVGPGSYNTMEEEHMKRKYRLKHHKLLGESSAQKRGLVRVGKNLVKAS